MYGLAPDTLEATVREVVADTLSGKLVWEAESRSEGLDYSYKARRFEYGLILRTRSVLADPFDLSVTHIPTGDKTQIRAEGNRYGALEELLRHLREASGRAA